MTVPFADFSDVTPVRSADSFYSTTGKRLVDVALVLLAAPVVVPLLAVIILISWAESGSPLFIQRRIGRGAREFRCWKIRTMVKDADAVLARLMAQNAAVAREWAVNQKLARDPRITRFGRFLRKSSLDELPQLLNVLNGTMSLVGPRPFTPEQKSLYAEGRADASYYSLRPGLSGLWQVSRRNAGSFGERAHYDEDYSIRMCLSFDLEILWRTFAVVLRSTGL